MPKRDEFVRLLRCLYAHFEEDIIDAFNVPNVPEIPKRSSAAEAPKEL